MAGATQYPYIIAACITAVPATLAATSAWYSAHQGRKEAKQVEGKEDAHFERLDAKFDRIDANFARMDLRFDSIEDKVERHLGWHRSLAEKDLPRALSAGERLDTNQTQIIQRDQNNQ